MQQKKKKKITVFLNENSNQSFWLPISFEMLIIMVTVLVKVRNYLNCVIFFFRLFFLITAPLQLHMLKETKLYG